jgi:hypothetical protein
MNDEPLKDRRSREQHSLVQQIVFGLLKEGIWQRPTPRLLCNPGFELCLCTRVKPLKAQVLQNILTVFQGGGFAFRHFHR